MLDATKPIKPSARKTEDDRMQSLAGELGALEGAKLLIEYRKMVALEDIETHLEFLVSGDSGGQNIESLVKALNHLEVDRG